MKRRRSSSFSLAEDAFPDVRLGGLDPPQNPTQSPATAFQVQTLQVRPRLSWCRRSRDATAASSRHTDSKRSETRLVPLNTDFDINTNPLEDPIFLQGLRSAGFLQPLDVSRKTIQRRFMHALKKEEFHANLEAFLEEHRLKARGQFMVRFRGPATEAHSPFVHIFTTALPSANDTCKVFPESTTSSSFTTWTPLDAGSASGSSDWACKARRFWPVRVSLEGPEAVPSMMPVGAAAPIDGRAARRKRRDTFQREVDLDDEIREREKQEALELLKNTDANSVPLGGATQLKVRTNKLEPATASAESVQNGQETQSPSTPTILDSVKQLGQSVAANWGPTVNKSIHELREWFAHRQLPSPFTAEVEAEEEERLRRQKQRHREKRRRERERRRRELEEAEALKGPPSGAGDGRQSEQDTDHENGRRHHHRKEHRRRHRHRKHDEGFQEPT